MKTKLALVLTLALTPAALPELEWPPMTMDFKATSEQLQGLKEGDEIEFEFTSEGMNSIITSIKQR